MDFWDQGLRHAVQALIPEVEGKSCVNIGDDDGGVYVCRRISGLHTDDDSFNGECEWVDPEDARPGELTDGMAISCDCVRLGPGWWQDTYFRWYFVYDPELVARSLAGDHTWVQPFLTSVPPLPPPPPPDLRGKAHRLLPPQGCQYLPTEEVVQRLRGQFAFFVAHPHQRTDEARQDCTFSVVVADHPDSMDYISFDLRPGQGILIGYRDEQHRKAATSLLERCARLLGYEAVVL